VSFWFCLKTIGHNEKIFQCRLGKIIRVFGPGLIFYNPLTDYLVTFEPRKMIVQSDKIILSFAGGKFHLIGDVSVEYCMENPSLAFAKLPNSEDYVSKMALIGAERLLRTKDALEIVQNCKTHEEVIRNSLQKVLKDVGYKVTQVDLQIVAAVNREQEVSDGGNDALYQ